MASSALKPSGGSTPPVGLFGEQTMITASGVAARSIASSGKRPVAGSIGMGMTIPPATVTSFSYSANVGFGMTTGVPGPMNAPMAAASSSFEPLPTRMFSAS